MTAEQLFVDQIAEVYEIELDEGNWPVEDDDAAAMDSTAYGDLVASASFIETVRATCACFGFECKRQDDGSRDISKGEEDIHSAP